MQKETIKVIAISDLHGILPPIEEMTPGDVLCITGDIFPLNVQRDFIESIVWLCTDFYKWVNELPYEKVIFIAGNHDFALEALMTDKNGNHRKAKRVRQKLRMPDKLIYLENSEYIYKGYRFYGAPWCPDLDRWAFYKDHDGLVHEFSKIPDSTDVLLTHTPPRLFGFGVVHQSGFNYLNNFGCDELQQAIHEKKPRLAIFGHVHSGQHMREVVDGTMYANVSVLDEDYTLVYNEQIFELTPTTVK